MKQQQKEEAVKLAMKHGLALMRRGTTMIGVDANGRETVIIEAKSLDSIWEESRIALQKSVDEKN